MSETKVEVDAALAVVAPDAVKEEDNKKKANLKPDTAKQAVGGASSGHSTVSDFSVDSGGAVNGGCPIGGMCNNKDPDDAPPIMNLVLSGDGDEPDDVANDDDL